MDWGCDGGSGGVGDNVVGGDSIRRGSVGDGGESAVTSMTSRSGDGVRDGGGVGDGGE